MSLERMGLMRTPPSADAFGRAGTTRTAFVLLHRWVGLAIAAFLFVAGLTGAVISWDRELDAWLNPHFHGRTGNGPPISSLALAGRIEAADGRVVATYVPLAAEPGATLSILVQPRVDPATGRPFEPGYNQVFLDPVTGAEIGRREWGRAWPLTRETLVSFLYKLHYSLHIPEVWGIDRWGTWLLGGIAMLWTLDTFVGFYLTLPTPRPRRSVAFDPQPARGWWRRWRPAWKVKTSGSPYRIAFDLHRAFSLWAWALLLMLAFTSFSLNLYREVFYPVISMISKVTPTPFDRNPTSDLHPPVGIGYASIVEQAQADASRRGWTAPLGAVGYTPQYGIYSAHFFRPGEDHGVAGGGPATLYYGGRDGRPLGHREPWAGTVADMFVQAQLPLHSGRILGLPGRILISMMGLVVAMLSVTGVVIWWRKRAARVSVRRKAAPVQARAIVPAE